MRSVLRSKTRPVAVLSALLATACSASAWAQKPPKPPQYVATDLSQVDADFAYQGEYMGYASEQAGSSYVKKWGVQVVARGDSTFDVVMLTGGLPGDGWNKQDRAVYPAQIEDGAISVQAGSVNLKIADNTVTVTDARGYELGELRKYDRFSPTLGKAAPDNALVLFKGEVNDLWKNMNVTEDGLLQEGCETTGVFGDFTLHLEFLLPYKPKGVGQDRGNSGVYLQRRYEVQVLDSFGEPGLPNQCGGIYTLIAPDQNMCLPPLTWQTYDIDFRMARFDDEGNKTENARIRVRHNGVVIHDGIELPSKTGAGRPEGPEKLSLLLQNHGNPVRYRNIWLVEHDPFVEVAPAPLTSTTAPGSFGVSSGRHGQPWGYGYEFRTPYHNYGFVPTYPLPYWYSSSFVDLPPWPFPGTARAF